MDIVFFIDSALLGVAPAVKKRAGTGERGNLRAARFVQTISKKRKKRV